MVEVLVAIVLLGGIVGATLTALRATVLSGTIHRDHTNAHAWLQSASDLLYARDTVPCNAGAADQGRGAVLDAYNLTADAVQNPQGWLDPQITVIDVQFWNGTDLNGDGRIDYRFATTCQTDLALQLLTIQVKSPNGRILETVSIVKG